MRVLPYMDNFLVLTDSFEDGLLQQDQVRRVLNRLGLQRNEKKGRWEPVQVIEHLAHVVYDDGDEETLNLSEEKVNILLREDVYEQNTERGGDNKENKRGGDKQNFLVSSLCRRWRDELGQSDFNDLAILMQRRSLLDSTLINYGPKARDLPDTGTSLSRVHVQAMMRHCLWFSFGRKAANIT
eukprot:gene14425-biopygen14882